MIRLKVWIGHYVDYPKEWFVVWAKSKDEAFLQIDPVVGEPDMDSFMELTAPGFVTFAPKKDETDEYFEYSPVEEDVRNGQWLVFGGAYGEFDEISEHIKSRIKELS